MDSQLHDKKGFTSTFQCPAFLFLLNSISKKSQAMSKACVATEILIVDNIGMELRCLRYKNL